MKTILLFMALLPLTAFSNTLPSLSNKELNSTLTQRGFGEFRRFGFHIYDITLWSKEATSQPPYALQIKYFKNIKAHRIVDASIDEMRNLELGASKEQLKNWEAELARVFPNVKDQDTITGLNLGEAAEFYLNDKLVGRLEDKQLVETFFAIWLNENTSHPKLRKKLLQIEES